MLKEYPEHPLLAEIDRDRNLVVEEQQRRGVTIDSSRLADDVLLKRRVMKRCIFGVDLNPLAVDLCKLSLWLDSFAIGVPLTYLNHHIKHGDSTIGMWRDDMTSVPDMDLDDYVEKTKRAGASMADISYSADVTVDAVRFSEDAYAKYEKRMAPHKTALDALTAFVIDKKLLPKYMPKMLAKKLGQMTEGTVKSDVKTRRIRDQINQLCDRYVFFHWDLEMIDAFTDRRRGFDVVVGNPPWDKVKPDIDEFFVQHYPAFASLNTHKEKEIYIREIYKENKDLEKEYRAYLKLFNDKNTFYKTYKLQSVGDRDLWKIMFERILNLVSKNGVISILIPSQILTSAGTVLLRKKCLELDIQQLYVFENKNKIFPIHREFRFVLLTLINKKGSDKIPSGFYIHNLATLENTTIEKDKFTVRSKQRIYNTSPTDLIITEVGQKTALILEKLATRRNLSSGFDGWNVELSSGLHKAKDSDLLRTDGKGCPVLEGKHTYQFDSNFSKPEFTVSESVGIERLSSKRVYRKRYRDFFNAYSLTFHRVSTPTVVRTTIAAILPPRTFHTYTLQSIIITHNGKIETTNTYNQNIAYLLGILNSTTFDFIIRSKIRLDVPTVIKNTPIPETHNLEIAELAAKLSVGTDEFEAFAESLHIDNSVLTPP